MTDSVHEARAKLAIPEHTLRSLPFLSRVAAEAVNSALDELIEKVRQDERARVYEEIGWAE